MKKTWKKTAAALMGILLLCQSVPVQASVDNGAVYSIATNAVEGWPQGPEMSCETTVLMDADTGTVLFDKGMNEKRYPASITKVMTALLALENSSMEEKVVFTEECLEAQASDSSNAGMQVGEELTMEQCLMLLMLKSANDVATQIAVHISGSVPAFAEKMNQRAVELGCLNTNFTNPHGLPDEKHYTSAYDMALIFREALKSEIFRNIISTVNYTLEPTNMNPERRSYMNHHAMIISSAPQYYEGCIGGKTGNTIASKSTLVTGAERNGMTLIAVVMRGEDGGQVCLDTANLFDYGFGNFKKLEVPGGNVILPADRELSELDIVETVREDGSGATDQSYYLGESLVGTGVKEAEPEITEEPEVITPEPAMEEPENLQPEPSQNEPENIGMEKIYHTAVYLLCGLIGLGILSIVLKSAHNRKKRKKDE